jgi:hypothetical protein
MRHTYRTLSDLEKTQMKTIKDFGLDFVEYMDKRRQPRRSVSPRPRWKRRCSGRSNT